jgi:nucleoid-associated protein YgaU
MKPTPGKQYLTAQGDTLERIASSAYGNPSKWPLINDVNQSQIKIGSTTEMPVGLTIIIPIDTELDLIKQKQLRNGLK